MLGPTLAARVEQDLHINTVPSFYWINSKMLTCVNMDITTPEQWRHVSFQDNPADIISRGLEPQHLQQAPQWMYGPFFLHGNEKHWPPTFCQASDAIICEIKQNPKSLLVSVEGENLLHSINHRNSLKMLQRVIAYALIKADRQNQPTLTPFELHDALVIIVRTTQQSNFKANIQRQNQLKASS